jgi:cyclic pyranopterin phosphate synthase
LDRITISLDGADAASIARMAGLQGGAKAGQSLLDQVLSGLEAARSAGFDPSQGALKLNAVIQKGRNDDQLIPLARLARDRGVELRLIEYMDVGSRNGWSLNQVMPALEMVQRVASHWPLDPVGRSSSSTTSRWQYRDGAGHLGVIASISAPFCGDCNRIRVTADGQIFTCLFASQGADLRPYLRASEPEAQLRERLSDLWTRRSDRFSEERRLRGDVDKPHAEMAYLGG